VDVGRGVQRGALEGLAEADVQGDVEVLAEGCEDGGGVVRGVSAIPCQSLF